MEEIIIYSDDCIEPQFNDSLKKTFDLLVLPNEEFKGDGLIYKGKSLSYQSHSINVCLNWEKQINYHQRQKYRVKKELLARSLGIKGSDYKISDLTCGTGKDSMLLVTFGAIIDAYERNPYVYCLLLHEYLRMKKVIQQKFSLSFGSMDKKQFQNLKQTPDALYFDPMFTDTNRKKSALKRKEMVLFDELVGDDNDAKSYLEEILEFGVKRVVVKRHPNSPKLLNGVTACFEGKNVRYDLYC